MLPRCHGRRRGRSVNADRLWPAALTPATNPTSTADHIPHRHRAHLEPPRGCPPAARVRFMADAFRAGTIVAVVAAVIGWFMVLRRQTLRRSHAVAGRVPRRRRCDAHRGQRRVRRLRLLPRRAPSSSRVLRAQGAAFSASNAPSSAPCRRSPLRLRVPVRDPLPRLLDRHELAALRSILGITDSRSRRLLGSARRRWSCLSSSVARALRVHRSGGRRGRGGACALPRDALPRTRRRHRRGKPDHRHITGPRDCSSYHQRRADPDDPATPRPACSASRSGLP